MLLPTQIYSMLSYKFLIPSLYSHQMAIANLPYSIFVSAQATLYKNFMNFDTPISVIDGQESPMRVKRLLDSCQTISISITSFYYLQDKFEIFIINYFITMFKQLIVVLAIFISSSYSSYEFSQSAYYYTWGNFTALAMSESKWTNNEYINVDVAIGTYQGEVIFLDSDDPNFSYSTFTLMDGPILWMDWSNAGVFLSTIQNAQVVDPYDGKSLLKITPNGVIANAIHAYRQSDRVMMIALSLPYRIQIYENKILAMNISTSVGKSTMCFDKTGKYLYYFDNNYRYVISILNRSVFGKTYSSYNYTSLTGSTRYNYEDITAAVTSYGDVSVWDDYGLLYSYSSSVSKMVTFSEYSDYMITFQQYGYLTIRSTSFSGIIGYWTTDQTISLSSLDITGLVAKNRKLIIVPKSSISYSIDIYKRNTTPSQLALFIIIGVAGVAIFAGITLCIVRRCKRANTNQYQAFNDQSNQGFNNNNYNQYNNQGYQPYPNQYNQPAPYQQNQYGQPIPPQTNQQSYPYFGNNSAPVYQKSQNPYAAT